MLRAEWEGEVDFGEVDVDEYPDAAELLKVQVLPTFLVSVDGGKEVARVEGADLRALAAEIQRRMYFFRS